MSDPDSGPLLACSAHISSDQLCKNKPQVQASMINTYNLPLGLSEHVLNNELNTSIKEPLQLNYYLGYMDI